MSPPPGSVQGSRLLSLRCRPQRGICAPTIRPDRRAAAIRSVRALSPQIVSASRHPFDDKRGDPTSPGGCPCGLLIPATPLHPRPDWAPRALTRESPSFPDDGPASTNYSRKSNVRSYLAVWSPTG